MPQRGEKREAKGVSKDKKTGRCLESKDVLLSFERREAGLDDCVGSCIYICDFMVMLKLFIIPAYFSCHQ